MFKRLIKNNWTEDIEIVCNSWSLVGYFSLSWGWEPAWQVSWWIVFVVCVGGMPVCQGWCSLGNCEVLTPSVPSPPQPPTYYTTTPLHSNTPTAPLSKLEINWPARSWQRSSSTWRSVMVFGPMLWRQFSLLFLRVRWCVSAWLQNSDLVRGVTPVGFFCLHHTVTIQSCSTYDDHL